MLERQSRASITLLSGVREKTSILKQAIAEYNNSFLPCMQEMEKKPCLDTP
ncbi:hypothetical protein BaRGS_00000807, partial [Batillaria attramentaria]